MMESPEPPASSSDTSRPAPGAREDDIAVQHGFPATDPPHEPRKPHEHDETQRHPDETIKETFESIIIAFVLAFVFRAYVVEAFVIPTGSMAPTLLGQHVRVQCEQCGYEFAVDPKFRSDAAAIQGLDLVEFAGPPEKGGATVDDAFAAPRRGELRLLIGQSITAVAFDVEWLREHGYEQAKKGDKVVVTAVRPGVWRIESLDPDRPFVTEATVHGVTCPMCHFRQGVDPHQRPSSGDRILVQKYIYNVFEPRRWDVIVFKNPVNPHQNFIKRLVGLPEEDLIIIEGNVYTRPNPAGQVEQREWWQHDDWRIARKIDPAVNSHWEAVQRAVWQPVYHSQYIPLDGGERVEAPWRLPWRDSVVKGEGKWLIKDEQGYRGPRGYRFDGSGRGQLTFDFDITNQRAAAWAPYNQRAQPHVDSPPHPLEDMRLAVHIMPNQPDVSLRLLLQARLDEQRPEKRCDVMLNVQPDGRADLRWRPDDQTPWQPMSPDVATVQLPRLTPGRTRAFELWVVDQTIIVWADGGEVMRHSYDFAMTTLRERPPLAADAFPHVGIEIAGGSATLYRIELDRDIYYYATRNIIEPGAVPALGGLDKTAGIPDPNATPIALEPDQFYCLGDNSAMSSDSRYWPPAHEKIRAQYLAEMAQRQGIVPRDLLMGRAFFVYFPAPYRYADRGAAIFPDFGRMRFIR